jgi:hypothetical protein
MTRLTAILENESVRANRLKNLIKNLQNKLTKIYGNNWNSPKYRLKISGTNTK